MDKINIGIIGCGHWGPNFIRNFSQIKGVSVKYACDLNPDRLSHIKGLYPQIDTTRDYLQILKDPKIGAVVISTPAVTHFRLAKEALERNKHVLVEKPITSDVDSAAKLVRIAGRYKRILMVGHTFKFNSGINKLRGLIRSGKIGRVYYIYSRRTNLGPIRRDIGAAGDLATHDISVFNYLLDKSPLSVSARGQNYLGHELEDVSFITLSFPGKVLAHMHVSWLDPKKVREIVVVGSKRMIIFDDLNPDAPISIYDKKVMRKKFRQDYDSFKEFQMIIHSGKVDTPKIKMEEPLKRECLHFVECIRKDRTPLTDGRDGLEVLKVLAAIQDSLSRNGAEVLLKE
ncbi:MAG: Gfo/Idh/MocA family oxidoreductase [Candidatus Omnitrophica bacterium]|nr:Gfo/Idh/MocA family oxidoreductase [Candidatus Omnitrophota bacterium]